MIGEGFLQPLGFFVRYGNDRSMTGREESLGFGVLDALERFQVFTLAELIVSARIAIVHEHPSAVMEAEHARTFNRLVGVLAPTGLELPCSSVVKIFSDKLFDAFLPAALSLKEDMEQSVVITDYIRVDACRMNIEEHTRSANQVGEVAVGIGPIDAVVGAGTIVGEDGEIDDIATCMLVVNGLWCPDACDVFKHRAFEAFREMDRAGFPMHEIL